MATTVERSLSRASSVSIPISSPILSVRHDLLAPPTSDPTLGHIHDRISQLDSRLYELRAAVLTKDGYIDRRNREDEHIRREFETHHAIASRLDVNVALLRTDVDQLKRDVSQIKTNLGQLGTDTVFIRGDVDRLQKSIHQVHLDLESLQTDVCGCRIELSKLHTVVSQIRTELLTLQHDTSQRLASVFDRFSLMDARMTHMDRVRFNSLAYTIHAPITPVPMIDDDGTLRYPDYFPSTVWRFWCLKKRSRVHRLVELAEFYELGGYQYWGRVYQDTMLPDDSDASESNERPNNLSRSEAVRQYPEACHQALAATLGLVYYKIRKEAGESPSSQFHRPPKRHQEEAMSNASSKQKPSKAARRVINPSPTRMHKLITGSPLASRSIVSKSVYSDDLERLGWNANSSDITEETLSKLKNRPAEEVHNFILRALERGLLKLKPSRSEQLNASPTESRAKGEGLEDVPLTEYDPPSGPNTVSTELISPIALGEDSVLPPTETSAV